MLIMGLGASHLKGNEYNPKDEDHHKYNLHDFGFSGLLSFTLSHCFGALTQLLALLCS